jgi:hypothetical protein
MGNASLAGRLRRIEDWARVRFYERWHGPLARLFVRGSAGMTPADTLRLAVRQVYWVLGRGEPPAMTDQEAREFVWQLRYRVFHP